MANITRKEKIQALIKTAKGLIGKPYKYGAYAEISKKRTALKKFDCSSFIQYIFNQIGMTLPRSSILQAAEGKTVRNQKKLFPGDVLFFEGIKGHYWHTLFKGKKIYIGHVALYIGNGEIIHARESKKMVARQKLQSLTKDRRYKVALIKRML